MPLEIPLTFNSERHENFWKKFGRILEIILVIGVSVGLYFSIVSGARDVPLIIGLSFIIIFTILDLVEYMKSEK